MDTEAIDNIPSIIDKIYSTLCKMRYFDNFIRCFEGHENNFGHLRLLAQPWANRKERLSPPGRA